MSGAAAALRTFTLRSGAGLEARVLAHGATLMRLVAPDRDGRPGDVVLGFDDPHRYLGPHPYLGGIVGRFANRIANARFELDGRTIRLTANDGVHCLHGGSCGFDRATWDAEPIGESAVELRHRSLDGDQGFPGNLDVAVVYRLDGRTLRLETRAECDAPTVVSLASHAYWNLEDGGATPVLDHLLQLDASHYTPVDDALIPTGELAPVDGTPFDFRAPRAIGARLDAPGLAPGGGYDHNFALDAPGDAARVALRLVAPRSGRTLALRTTLPGIQLYGGSCFDGAQPFRADVAPPRHAALAIEAQQFPNAPNEPRFPSPRLDPGAVARHLTVYELGTA
ncbi:MAG: galactose-1-epimerase [Proteobacteria bacterium]|nr:MAG: galactose-1-epimerase [Pseudomonadota bacterium]